MVELVVAMSLMLAIAAGAFAAIQASPDAALVQSEAVDMQQRLRVAVDAIARDAAGASSVRPSRWGGTTEDPPGTFRSDTITFVLPTGTQTYWLKSDPPTDTFQLTQWSGGTSADVPVVDHVVALQFAYLDAASMPLTDADLPGLRSIAVTIRLQAAAAAVRGPAGPFFIHGGSARTARRWVPDLELHVQLTPRNLNLER
jgi:type II secretory pathway pseudopilin PulG